MSQGSFTLDLCLLCLQSEEKGRSKQWYCFSETTKLGNTIHKPWQVSILLFNQEKVKYIIRQIPHKIKSWHVMEKKKTLNFQLASRVFFLQHQSCAAPGSSDQCKKYEVLLGFHYNLFVYRYRIFIRAWSLQAHIYLRFYQNLTGFHSKLCWNSHLMFQTKAAAGQLPCSNYFFRH